MSTVSKLRIDAINRHRERLFGCSSLKVQTMTPEDGEVTAATFTKDWRGHRVYRTTDQSRNDSSGAWQFEIVSAVDWRTSQAFMLSVVALTIEGQRWKVSKVEKPIGQSFVWKLKAEIQ